MPRRQDPLIGAVLGDTYRLVRRIGEGGMAHVYEAEHTRIERRFAVKILHLDSAALCEALPRFEREARIGSQLGHPHIVEVIDFNRIEVEAQGFQPARKRVRIEAAKENRAAFELRPIGR
jgi:serine/threonine-protein kinase